MPSLLVFRSISTDFTPTPTVPSTPSVLNLASFFCSSKVELWKFNRKLGGAPTDPLRPINPDNAWRLCITAPAGTELGTPYSIGTINPAKSGTFSQLKAVYDPKAFFLHAASLHQAFAHCGIFSTAATRRCTNRVSVSSLEIGLSPLLPVIALVSHYLTN